MRNLQGLDELHVEGPIQTFVVSSTMPDRIGAKAKLTMTDMPMDPDAVITASDMRRAIHRLESERGKFLWIGGPDPQYVQQGVRHASRKEPVVVLRRIRRDNVLSEGDMPAEMI